MSKTKKIKAFILAAGLGTRLKPFTDNHPKALAIVNGQTLLERNINNLIAQGIADIVINIHHFPQQIIDFIARKKFAATITFSDESDTVLETGGGLLFAKPLLSDAEAVLIWNVDILSDIKIATLIEKHFLENNLATLVVSDRPSSRKLLFANERLCGWTNTEKNEYKWVNAAVNDCTPKSFAGIHIVATSIFDKIKQTGKFSIIDAYLDLAKDNAIAAFDAKDVIIIDVGKPAQITAAEKYFI